MTNASANAKSCAILRRRKNFARVCGREVKNPKSDFQVAGLQIPGRVEIETVDFTNRQLMQIHGGKYRQYPGKFFQKIHDRPQTTQTSASPKKLRNLKAGGILRVSSGARPRKNSSFQVAGSQIPVARSARNSRFPERQQMQIPEKVALVPRDVFRKSKSQNYQGQFALIPRDVFQKNQRRGKVAQ